MLSVMLLMCRLSIRSKPSAYLQHLQRGVDINVFLGVSEVRDVLHAERSGISDNHFAHANAQSVCTVIGELGTKNNTF